MLFRSLACSVVLVSLVAACDRSSDDGLSPTNAALVQFVNASSTGSVTMANGSQGLGGVLAFQQASGTCELVPAGSQSLQFAANGLVVANTGATTFTAGQRYTVILQGTGASRSTIVVPEVFTTQTSGYGLRLVNATGITGNVYVTAPTASIGTAATATLTAGSATGGTAGNGGFMTVASTDTRVRFYNTTSTATPLADITITNPSSTAGTTIAFANTASGGVAAFQINQCAAP